jgi:rhamnosyltransferase subunit B
VNVLLFPIGSHGDVHPFVGLGLVLKARGHRVTLIANEHFGTLAARVGLDYEMLGTEADFRQALNDPGLWKPMEGFRFVVKYAILRSLRPIFERIKASADDRLTVVVAPVLAFGARVAQERLGVPLATVILQPSVIRSLVAPPVLPFHWLVSRLPIAARRLFFRYADARLIDPLIGPEVNAFRAELGLPPVRRFMKDWWVSPDLVVGLYPPWFAPIAPDWPSQVVLTGFPLFDESASLPLGVDVASFLDAGPPPIVFTPGSGNAQARDFLAAAVDACRRLDRRGLLLTRFPEQVPADLPDGVRHFGFVPFSQVLPRSSALVHHGGIGTSAQGLAAGIPQLIMPLAHDQPDNADRLERLGVARSLPPARFLGPAVARKLGELLDSGDVALRCRELAARTRAGDPLTDACAAIEGLRAAEPAAVR